jgi:hypothetical protein
MASAHSRPLSPDRVLQSSRDSSLRRGVQVRRGRLALSVLAVLLTVSISDVTPADAARGLETGFQDDLFTSSDPSERATWLDRTVHEDAGIVRINVYWNAVASSRPLAPTNPLDPAYDFNSLDSGVSDARARGLDVLLTVLSAPSWAEGPNRPSNVAAGTWKPSPRALGHFAQALAKRYSGNFLGLPRVRFFQAWNEPNLSEYLTPQWSGRTAKSPKRFRSMLNAFYGGVKKAQPHAKVITAGIAPNGDPPGGERMRPLIFLRHLFCLNHRLKPTKCGSKPHLDVLADHPITTSGGPHTHARSRNDVFVADFHKVRRVLHAAERARHVRPGGHHPLWVSELWWITRPPNQSPFAFPLGKQARWIEESFYILWKQGVRVVVNRQIRDSQYDPQNPLISLQTGVYLFDGKPKPSARTFRFPFVTHRRSRTRVGVWGKAPRSGALKVQTRRHGGWRTLRKLKVRRGQVFTPSLKLRGAAKLRGKIGATTSRSWHQRK